jgi:hypothetical protein
MGYSGNELVRCSLCDGSLPAFDVETQVEHMTAWHEASSNEDAKTLVSEHFKEMPVHNPLLQK